MKPPLTSGPHNKGYSAADAEELRQAHVTVRRGNIQNIVIQRRHRRRREAKPESVEREMMKTPAKSGEAIVYLVAAIAVTPVEILEPQRVVCRLTRGGTRYSTRGILLPKSAHA